MYTKLINFILLTFLILPTVGYAKVNEPLIASPENIKLITEHDGQLLSQDIFLYAVDEFNILENQIIQFQTERKKIIIQVTGSQPTFIKGEWQKDNADIYILNPNGITIEDFKPKYRLSNNLYLSTAHYFSPQTNQFHFQTTPQPIEIKNSVLKFEQSKTLSVIGGKISHLDSNIILPDGDLYMIAGQSEGYVKIEENGNYQSFFDKLADIEINRKLYRAHNPLKIKHTLEGKHCELDEDCKIEWIHEADIDLTGQGGGLAFLRAHNLIFDNGWIFSDTKTDWDGKGIDIKADNNLELRRAGRVTTDVMGGAKGKGGNIKIVAQNKVILDSYTFELYKYKDKISNKEDQNFDQMFSTIATNVYGKGNGGDIKITTKQLIMKNRGAIQASLGARSQGNGGSVYIKTAHSVELESYSQFNMFTLQESEGKSGNLTINTSYLKLQDSIIRLQTLGDGYGGKGSINAEKVEIFNTNKNLAWIRPHCHKPQKNNAYLKYTNSERPQASILGFVRYNAKSASDIFLKTNELIISEGGYIDTTSLSQNDNVKGGEIHISANNVKLVGETCPSRILTKALKKGDGGDIILQVNDNLTLKNGSEIIASSYDYKDKDTDFATDGMSGNIDIRGKDLLLDSGSQISVESKNKKKAGIIKLKVDNIDIKNQSYITAESTKTGGGNLKIELAKQLYLSNQSKITASTQGSKKHDDGGNIDIYYPEKLQSVKKAIILNNGSFIEARANEGRGGNIKIKTGVLLRSIGSKITADSDKGIDGVERIEELDTNFMDGLIPQQTKFPNNLQSITFRPCSTQEQNHLYILEQEYLTSHPFLSNSATTFKFKQATLENNPTFLYAQQGEFEVTKIVPEGHTRFKREIDAIIEKQKLPKKLSRWQLMQIQDEIQALYDEYYNEQIDHENDQGQIYSTHTTVRIPNQDVLDGVVKIQIAEERLTDIQFFAKEGTEYLPFHPDFIASHLKTGSIFRVQELHQALKALLEKGMIKKFDAHLQTGAKASEKILHIHVEGVEPPKLTQKPNTVEYHNQLCWNDYTRQTQTQDLQEHYGRIPLNRTGTFLELFSILGKQEKPNLAVTAHNDLQKITLNQPIYQKLSEIYETRTREEMQLSFKVKKQHFKTKTRQKPFDMFIGMLKGQKTQYAYEFGQQWLKADEKTRAEQINSSFEMELKNNTGFNIYHYQYDKKWNDDIYKWHIDTHWKLNSQFANQYTSFINNFSLNKDYAIRGYPENKFKDNNGISSRFDAEIKRSRFSISVFFDIGSVWSSKQYDAGLVNTLWDQAEQNWFESLQAYNNNQSKTKQSELAEYIQKLKQPLWKQQAQNQLSKVLLKHWQNTLDACHEIFDKPIDMDKLNELNIYEKAKNPDIECRLQVLMSTGINFKLNISGKSVKWAFAKKLF